MDVAWPGNTEGAQMLKCSIALKQAPFSISVNLFLQGQLFYLFVSCISQVSICPQTDASLTWELNVSLVLYGVTGVVF